MWCDEGSCPLSATSDTRSRSPSSSSRWLTAAMASSSGSGARAVEIERSVSTAMPPSSRANAATASHRTSSEATTEAAFRSGSDG